MSFVHRAPELPDLSAELPDLSAEVSQLATVIDDGALHELQVAVDSAETLGHLAVNPGEAKSHLAVNPLEARRNFLAESREILADSKDCFSEDFELRSHLLDHDP